MASLKEYINNASSQTIGRIGSMGANFIVFIMVARIMGTELFGQYSYIMIFLGLVVLVAEFGTNSVLARDIAQTGADSSKYWGNFIVFRTVLTVLVSATAIPVALLVRPDLFQELLLGCIGIFFLGSRFFDPIFQVFNRPWFSMICSLIYAGIYAIASIVVLYFFPSIFSLIAVYIVANIVYTVIAFSCSHTLLKPTFNISYPFQKKILLLAIPIGISSIFTLVHTRADIFMLAYIKGDWEVGIYTAAYRFLDMAVILAVMITNPMVPIFSRQAMEDRSGLRNNISRIYELSALLIIPIAVITPLLSPLLISLLFGNEFTDASRLLNIMSWIGILTFYSMLNFVTLLSLDIVRFQIWLGALAAILNVTLNYYYIPRYSYIGAAWVTFTVECLFVGVTFIYLLRGMGNIFFLKNCLKIGGANLLIFLFIHSAIVESGYLMAFFALLLYSLLCYSLGLTALIKKPK